MTPARRGAPPRRITIFTHQYPVQTAEAVKALIGAATAAGIEVLIPPDEVEKHRIGERGGCVLGADPDSPTDLAVVFGGDGTILLALRRFAGRGVPVFAFNFGAIGFLSTVDHGQVEDGVRRVLSGDYAITALPALEVESGNGPRMAVNDVSFHRRPNSRVAELEYSVRGEALGSVRCDGLVVSTPVGSTGYNLANGGPILAWGVEGYVVSFIAPHTLTARSLVVAPTDPLTVRNLSTRDDVDVTTDGRTVMALPPGGSLDVHWEDDRVLLAQLPGATFYHQIREKFGRLAS